jgi:UDP-N-acetylmuramoyl-L-alanyl-D-glutamate--2,6-diaminopimelate ligase
VQLAELLAGTAWLEASGDLNLNVTGIAYHSDRVRAGDLFVAWRGGRFDGHSFLDAARAAGAPAAVVERPLADLGALPGAMTLVRVADSRAVLGPLSARLFGHPTARLGLCGVTGTNGKTTTTFLIREVLRRLGPVGLIGTVSAIVGGESRPLHLTTPEAADLQALFADMVAVGDRFCVMEASSMALSKRRVDGCAFDVAVFTNLTRDHLGPTEHPTFAHYRDSKARLFGLVGRGVAGAPTKDLPRGAAVNADDPAAEGMASMVAPALPVLRYGLGPGAAVRAEDVGVGPDGASFTIVHPGGRDRCTLRLAGRFNVYNALAAFCVGTLYGLPGPEVAAALGRVAAVPGRMERVPGPQPFAVFVDYAHTPDGLDNVLRAAREISGGRVIAVFGCGGDRDRSKRPLMGGIAARLADLIWLTSDNPRSEPPEAILAEIAAGAAAVAGARFAVVPDRGQAIAEALAAARPGDAVVIAGKGHETRQIFADRTIHFDDREEAAAVLSRLGYR